MAKNIKFLFPVSKAKLSGSRLPRSLAEARGRTVIRTSERVQNPPSRPVQISNSDGPTIIKLATHRRSTLRRHRFQRLPSTIASMMENPQSHGSFLTLSSVADTRKWVAERKAAGRVVGLVPTMGALHEGHLDLVERAASECDDIIVSIYVNPTQFAANEDLSTYPRPFTEDLRKLDALNQRISAETKQGSQERHGRVTAIFNPDSSVMYPFDADSGSKMIIEPQLTQRLEGHSRPTFFQGVTTVVLKLLNVVQPDLVFFGQKDIQQLVVIRRMIDEFHIPTTLRGVPTRREADGLAMSSRNVYLGARRRKVAKTLYQILTAGIEAGTQRGDHADIDRRAVVDTVLAEAVKLQTAQQQLPPKERVRFELDYISLADPVHLREVDVVKKDIGAILSGAIIMLPLEEPQPDEQLGLGNDEKTVRLIDNFLLGRASRLLGISRSLYRTIKN